ncbi:MAG: orotate phosphoribosyltransferase [Burkholderiaceae bacterium]
MPLQGTLVSQELREYLRTEFIRFAMDSGVLRFGEFKTKAGRLSPYFFNAGLFHDGARLGRLAEFYARTLLDAEKAGHIQFDMLFGPAYKGIPLVSTVAVALWRKERNVAFAYNRKEAKDHGEGGNVIGAPLQGRVVIVDDVISAGTSVRESVRLIRDAGATPAAVLIALDRCERGGDAEQVSALSAVQEVERDYGIPVISIAALDDIFTYLDSGSHATGELMPYREKIAAYRERYGVNLSSLPAGGAAAR